ncbi:hypothetical protein Q5752_001290 [Cryptotrichosporon argae]
MRPPDEDCFYDTGNAAFLTRKYGFDIISHRLPQRILSYTSLADLPKFALFEAWAILKNAEICVAAVRAGRTWTWPGDSTVAPSLNGNVAGASVFDVSSWSRRTSGSMPEDFRMALLRAGRGSNLDPVRLNATKLADDFKRLLGDTKRFID